jgi:dynein heavy chain
VLCLPNGERIKLNPTTMRMLFEVQDLAVASPATVSRCGMVYVPPEELGWRPYVKSWLQRLSQELSTEDKTVTVQVATVEHMWGLFEGHVDKGLGFVRQKCAESIASVDINLVTSLCFYIQVRGWEAFRCFGETTVCCT